MSGDDVHTPTHAGPVPLRAPTGAAPAPAPGPAALTGSASAGASTDNPEVIVGAAFAGGLIAALILKRLVR
jgi:hypothetical protein